MGGRSPPKSHPRRPPVSNWRILLTIAVGFLTVFLFLRTFAVEPFGVPTGSMAPALIGNHREGPCPRCGHPIRVGIPAAGDRSRPFADVTCPNCGKRTTLADAIDINGDRLLVDKNIFNLRSPRRWEVAVFRCASDLSKPYVKRVIGLPGEEIVILDGDVYANGELLRKGLAEVRETRIPLFDLAYSPSIGGWGPRWLVYHTEPGRATSTRAATADNTVLQNGTIVLDASANPQHEIGLEYRNWNLDEMQEEPVRAWTSYDGTPRSSSNLYPAHDFVLTCEVEVTAIAEQGTFACRLFDGLDGVSATFAFGQHPAPGAWVARAKPDRTTDDLRSSPKTVLKSGRTYKLEFAFVDRRVILAVDGTEVVLPTDLAAVPKRGEVTRPLQLGARGCRVVVRNLKIYRDIHYTQAGRHGTRIPARLSPTEYYLLGDNSGNSQDSREWPEPGVPEGDFIGKPFLVHQPLRLGRVTWGGQERLFQTLDWSRLRWLH